MFEVKDDEPIHARSGKKLRRFHNMIDGESRPARSDVWLPSVNPATAEAWAEVPPGEAQDIDDAVRRRSAPSALAQFPALQRAALLRKLARDGEVPALAHRNPRQRQASARRWAATYRRWRKCSIIGPGPPTRFTARPSKSGQRASTMFGTNRWEFGDHLALEFAAGPFHRQGRRGARGGQYGRREAARDRFMLDADHRRPVRPGRVSTGRRQCRGGARLDAGDAVAAHPDIGKISFTGSTATARAITRRSADAIKPLTSSLAANRPTSFSPTPTTPPRR